MTYRNGVVADTLRAAGMDCYRIIFGLNLPQLSAIARELQQSHNEDELRELALELEADTHVRESRLLAYHLYGLLPSLSLQQITRMAGGVQTREEAEILCLRVLRNHPGAQELLAALPDSGLQAHLRKVLARHLEG